MKTNLYFTQLESPLGTITLTATDQGLSGLYFAGQKHWPTHSETWQRDDGARFDACRAWLEAYFNRRSGAALPALDLVTGTPFQQRVWRALLDIPWGQTRSYSQLAQAVHAPKAVRAVGAAVGRNPLSLILPCHRVIGQGGALTGYAGGLDRKGWLLAHEQAG